MKRTIYFILIVSGAILLPTISHAASTWSMTVVGDIMLDRYVRDKIQKFGADYPYEKIKTHLTGDVVLANLEGPFTKSTKHAVVGGPLSFTFDEHLASSLKRAGFTTLLLGNNHTLNQGQAGLNNTRNVLKKNRLEFFGDPHNGRNFHLTKNLNGENVTFLGYDNLDGRITNVLTDVRNAHLKGEYVIVVPHWGAEYTLGIQPALQRQAKQLIDAGADMILGGHPHVVEPFEIYKGKFIAYSLGNFVFDQYFSYHTQEELMVKLNFTPTNVQITLVPLTSLRSQPTIASPTATKKLLDRLSTNSLVSPALKKDIQQGSFTIPR